MAIILGSRQVLDVDPARKVGIGIDLPIQRGDTGFFKQTFNTADAVKANIKNLLLTRKRERLMQPEFGTSLWNILFENDTDDTPIAEKIEKSIESAIKYWLPFVSIEQIDINKDNPTNRDKNIYTVSILFRTNDLQELNTVTFKLTD